MRGTPTRPHQPAFTPRLHTQGIIGTDGRPYVIDLYRSTPVDANFITAAIPAEEAGAFPTSVPFRHQLYLVRPELVSSYYEVKYIAFLRGKLEARGVSTWRVISKMVCFVTFGQ